MTDFIVMCNIREVKTRGFQDKPIRNIRLNEVAERGGFEPPVELPLL